LFVTLTLKAHGVSSKFISIKKPGHCPGFFMLEE
jgi:hypothetical protein